MLGMWRVLLPLALSAVQAVSFVNPVGWVHTHLPLPTDTPDPIPAYMRSNIHNEHGTAPDKGLFNGPVLGPISDEAASKIKIQLPNGTFLASNVLNSAHGLLESITDSVPLIGPSKAKLSLRQSGSYWLSSLGSKGRMPLAETDFKFFRNVKDYGATGDGSTDDTAAINKAASDGKVCGYKCGSTSVHASIVYFPPGTYRVSSPIIQYFGQQFIGDANSPPTLQGLFNFTGIAIVDSDVYIPGGGGQEWFINQSNFLRSIQNINFDLTRQARKNVQNDQTYVPTGIHWQVGQGTSITNCQFKMSGPSAVGIFMENGSGGFMADLKFTGGNAGMIVGSQQFTFRNLQFIQCAQAISLLWNWGMTFQNVYIESCPIGFNMTAHGGITGQGTGSISLIDSHFNGVSKAAITVPSNGTIPNILLDNVRVESTGSVVQTESGTDVYAGSGGDVYITQWALGGAYLDSSGVRQYLKGFPANTPNKPATLLDGNGNYFTRSKPFYGSDTPLVATDSGVKNDMTGDQTSAINSLLANNIGKVVFFPAGIYLVKGTVFIPKGSKIIGSGFSQIMATGLYFQNKTKPNVMVRVGNKGDSGVVEIQDMLWTVQGPTAGCILMEWNIAQSSQGSAAMWNSNFRVGGAAGTSLQTADCQGAKPGGKCDAATIMLRVTSGATGYFENVWAWVADHDLDDPNNANAIESKEGVPLNVQTNVNIYAARGILIESQGPTWFWASSSEHSELYNYQLVNAKNVFFSHMQTESPYYQPETGVAAYAYAPNSGGFTLDPTFFDCSARNCYSSWAFRLLSSAQIFVYSTGFYSFFNNQQLGCGPQQNCQQHLIETNHVGSLYYYNIFTYGGAEIVSPAGGSPPPIFFNDSNQNGYTSEVVAYLALADSDASSLGVDLRNGSSGSGVVFIDPTVWQQPTASRTIGCIPPCTFVLPPSSLASPTTITFPLWTTTIEVGWTTTSTITTTVSNTAATITTTYFTSVIQTTVLKIPPVTTTKIPFWEITLRPNTTTATLYPTSSVLPPFIVVTDNPNPLNQTGVTHPPVSRTIYPPPWPWYTTTSSQDPRIPPFAFLSIRPQPTCLAGCGTRCQYSCSPCNPLPLVCNVQGNCCTGPDFCKSSCPPGTGPGNNGYSGPNDPNNDIDDDDEDDKCSTVTASSCSQLCVSSSCTTTCKTTVGCSKTNTNVASTVTPAPNVAGFDDWYSGPEDESVALSNADVQESSLASAGYANPGGAPASTVVVTGRPRTYTTTVTKIITTTITTLTSSSSLLGSLEVGGLATTLRNPKNGGILSGIYDVLNYRTIDQAPDPCGLTWTRVIGYPTPNLKGIDELPTSLTFTTSSQAGTDLPVSRCTYTNSQLRCANNQNIGCTKIALEEDDTFYCSPEFFGNGDKTYTPLLWCDYYTGTSGTQTITSTYTTTSASVYTTS